MQTRRSPRKKQAASYNDTDLGHDEEILEPLELTPKLPNRLLEKPQTKQLRLGSFNTVQKAAAPLQLQLGAEPRRRRNYQRPVALPAKLLAPKHSPPHAELTARSAAPSASVIESGEKIEESDVEESVWCGSDASSEDSEDELPSPSKLIKFQPKKATAAPPSTARIDLNRTFKSLSLDEPDQKYHNASEASRPTSSSDKENDDAAILRFSPPRLYSPPQRLTAERQDTPPPTSPSKGRLLSPSKQKARMPTPPLRPSIDAFWNAETVNDWNDQYSPRKEWKSPKKLNFSGNDKAGSPITASPRKPQSPTKRTKAEIDAKKGWEARKHDVAQRFLTEVDRVVAGGQVQDLARSTGGVRFIWSKTLNSTAGRANWKRETTKTKQTDGSVSVVHKHHASIELAEKVIGDEERLLNVIAHEFCHLCNFMISGIKDQPHGRQFKEWGRKCTNAFGHRGVEVTTKHSYQIEYKYIWQCSNEECAAKFQRHSRSIDPKRHKCGSCRNNLVQIKPVPRQGAAAGGTANGYAGFVKQHFAAVKAGMPGASQKQVMEAVGQKYRAEKASNTEKAPTAKSKVRSPDVELAGSRSKPDEGVEKVAAALNVVTLDDG